MAPARLRGVGARWTIRAVRKALLALALAGCGASSVAPAEAPPAPAPPARLVVVVVLDQLGWATLERYLPALDEGGALRRLAREGVHRRVVFQHAGTYTAAGHASIHTGVSPRVHGVMANEVHHPTRGQIASVDDGEHAVFGMEDAFASPSVLRAPTVADALRAAHPDARIVSVSLKDRGAVIPGGQRPDAVVFWDKGRATFTTSAYYADAPWPWLTAFLAAHPPPMAAWTPEDPARLEALLGPDARDGEGGLGFGATFPHDPSATDAPGAAFRGTPRSTEHLLALARAAVDHHAMGADEIPDLLAISISGTDYVGHAFGPGSWEYLDHLIRVDRALGAFLDALEADVGPVAVLVTSDHGHGDVAEAYEGGGRIVPEPFAAELDTAMDRALGEGEWVVAFDEPFAYLSEAGRADDSSMQHLLTYLRSREGVARAYDARRVPTDLADAADPIDRLVFESVASDPPGDVLVVPAEGWYVDDDEPFDAGASHGTPYAYDREVPVLFAGAGVPQARDDAPLDQRRVAATIAALLGIEPPGDAPAALPGAPR